MFRDLLCFLFSFLKITQKTRLKNNCSGELKQDYLHIGIKYMHIKLQNTLYQKNATKNLNTWLFFLIILENHLNRC